MIMFRLLKLFGVDIPGHIAQLQARFEQRVEVAKDEVRQTAQKAAIVAALAAVGGLAALSAAGVVSSLFIAGSARITENSMDSRR